MKIAVEGCSHGELDAIYASVLRAEREQGFTVDVLLLCGDFQAIRNHADLNCLAVPAKYRQLGGFHRYYSGQMVAPLLTIVIGGNHEASNYMWELYHGGWLAPNIYFLGAAGAVEVGGLVIAGASGIYKAPDYNKGRFERLPFDNSTMRSTYHTRFYDIHRLKLLGSADVVLSHDWPNTIEQHGDTARLIKKKPFFKGEIETETLGSPPLLELLKTLQPAYWFAAHLHVRFAALYDHRKAKDADKRAKAVTETEPNPEAIDIEIDDDDGENDNDNDRQSESVAKKGDVEDEDPAGPSCDQAHSPAVLPTGESDTSLPAPTAPSLDAAGQTRFLALSKCLPQGDFLQYLDIPAPHDADLAERKASSSTERTMPTFRYSKRWLAISRALHSELSLGVRQAPLPPIDDPTLLARIRNEEVWVDQHILSAAAGASASEDGPTGLQPRSEEEGKDGEVASEPPPPGGHALDVLRVQRFVRTAPAPFEPGGLMQGHPSWYTNPQTEAFCHLLGIENKINPLPPHMHPPRHTFPPAGAGAGAGAGEPWFPDAQGRPPFLPAHAFPTPGGFPAPQFGGPPPNGFFRAGPAPPGWHPGSEHGHFVPEGARKRQRQEGNDNDAENVDGAEGRAETADGGDPNALDIDDNDFEVDETADVAPFAIDEDAQRWTEGTG